jgi:chromosome segregation ATPase
MLKKLLIAAVAVLVGLIVVKKTDVGSYARVWLKNARACASRQVPVETEIERLRDEVARIGADSKSHYSAIAEEMVAVDNLKKEIVTHEANLGRQKKNILALKEDLASGNEYVVYGDTRYSRDRVKAQLARDFEAYKAAEANLAAKRKLLEARESTLTAAKEQMRAMQEARRDLEVELARLEAEYKTVRVAQTKSKFHLDDSELSRIKEGVAKLRDRVKVEQTTLALQADFSGGPIPVTERVKEKDLLKDIDAHFSGKAPKSDKVAAQK